MGWQMNTDTEPMRTNNSGQEPMAHESDTSPFKWHRISPIGRTAPRHSLGKSEFVCFLERGMRYLVAGQTFDAHEGDALYMDAGVPRLALPNDDVPSVAGSLAVHPSVLYGSKDSVLWTKYLQILEYPAVPHAILLRHDGDEWERRAARLILEAWEAVTCEIEFFEETARHSLTLALLIIAEHLTAERNAEGRQPSKRNVDRLKKMMSFIEDHYSEDITLQQIADAANVSIREVQREFQEVMSERPMSYLANYRLAKAAELIQTTDQKIGDIAIACGFNSQSYFTKCFCSHYGIRPTMYRNVT